MSNMIEPEALKFEKLDEIRMLEHKAQLEMLEHLSVYINSLRESLTRELIVNDVKSEEDLEKRLKKIKIDQGENNPDKVITL